MSDPAPDVFWRSSLRFDGPRLVELREEAGLSRRDLAARLQVPWQLLALWESGPTGTSPDGRLLHEPMASQVMDLARALDTHPVDLYRSLDDEPAGDQDHEAGSRDATGQVLDGLRLRAMRRSRRWSIPQAAARARVHVATIQAAEAGRTINAGALLRLLELYEPSQAPLEALCEVVVRSRRTRKGRP